MANPMSVYEEELHQNHSDFIRLKSQIRDSIPQIKITSIRKVYNEHLSLAFTIKEDELRRRCGRSRSVGYLHATSATNVASILQDNLDWRLVRRSKYGKGVSFSYSAKYANTHKNKTYGVDKAFVICDLLEGNRRQVHNNDDTHPPKNIDSYLSYTCEVLVKFDDFTFNPTFVVYYEGIYDISPDYSNFVDRYRNPCTHQKALNQEERELLKKILRVPFKNEGFLNAIVAEKERTLITEQPRPSQSPNQPAVMPNDPVSIEEDEEHPVTKNDSEQREVDQVCQEIQNE